MEMGELEEEKQKIENRKESDNIESELEKILFMSTGTGSGIILSKISTYPTELTTLLSYYFSMHSASILKGGNPTLTTLSMLLLRVARKLTGGWWTVQTILQILNTDRLPIFQISQPPALDRQGRRKIVNRSSM